MYLAVKMHRILQMKKQMTYMNGIKISLLFPDRHDDLVVD